MWLVHQFAGDDSNPREFVGTYAIVENEAQANAVIACAPTSMSIVEGYLYSKQQYAMTASDFKRLSERGTAERGRST